MNFKDKVIGTLIRLKIFGDESKHSNYIKVSTEAALFEIILPKEEFTDKEISSVKSTGNTVASLNQFTGSSTNYGSYFLALFSSDPSGSLIKFSQMNKLISRLRFINVQYGVYLDSYFGMTAKKYDPPSPKGLNHIYLHSDGYIGKFTSAAVSLDIFEVKLFNVILYLLSWAFKLYCLNILFLACEIKKISRLKCKLINYSQKFHFITFNMIVLDIFFYCMRTLNHTKGLDRSMQFWSLVLVSLVIIDIIEIWNITSATAIDNSYSDITEEIRNYRNKK